VCFPAFDSLPSFQLELADLMGAAAELILTPRMHGIHHSIVERETNSNWSSGLTVWDWLHGTLRLNVPQADVTIGVPAFQEPPIWEFPNPNDGSPQPHSAEAPNTLLLP
jgi:hypothetical protein